MSKISYNGLFSRLVLIDCPHWPPRADAKGLSRNRPYALEVPNAAMIHLVRVQDGVLVVRGRYTDKIIEVARLACP